MPAPRRLTAVLIGGAVALTPALLTAVPAEAATASVALVGDLQSEVGCPGDWDPACTQSELTRVGDTEVFKGTFEVPEGDFAFKVALNGSWAENYGAGGTFNGDNIALLIPERFHAVHEAAMATTSRCCSPARRRSPSPSTTPRTWSPSRPPTSTREPPPLTPSWPRTRCARR